MDTEKGFKRFEQIDAWQQARILTRDIYDLTNSRPFASDFPLRNQIRSSGISVMSNIAEGFVRRHPAEFIQFLSYAKASCAEVQSQLYVALDAGHISGENFKRLQAQADRVSRMIHGLRKHVESSRIAKP